MTANPTTPGLTPEEQVAIQRDLDAAKQSLLSKEQQDAIAKAREDAKQEATREMELKKQAEDAQKRAAELEAQMKAKDAETAKKLTEFQQKLDSMVSSRAVVTPPNFNAPQQGAQGPNAVDKWSDAQVDKFEEAHARAFLGTDYDRFGED